MAHPLGIQPEGNMYIHDGPNIRESSLGALAVLPDALLLDILAPGGGGGLTAADLGRLALASKALYCFANLEESWKGLVLEELGGCFRWAGCWQRTYLLSTGRITQQQEETARARAEQEEAEERAAEDAEAEEEKEQAAKEQAEAEEKERAAKEEAAKEEEEQEEGRRGSKRRKTGSSSTAAGNGAQGSAKGEKGAGPAAVKAEQPGPNSKAAGAKGKGEGKAAKGKGRKADDDGAAASQHEDEAAAGPGPSSTAAAAAATANSNGVAATARRLPLLRRLVLPGPLLTTEEEADDAAPGTATAGKKVAASSSGSSSRALCLQRYLQVRGFYSDLLYQPWFCANFEMPPDWLQPNNIDRRAGLTPEQFRVEYEIPNRPVILTDAMSGWAAMSKWSNDYLTRVFGDKDVIVGNMPMPFSTYAAYAAANADEMPLYLFDKQFTATAPALASDYHVPEQFGEDLFGLLGETGRPDYRWLILGPARSGSSFHVDPNATSAWNALVWGAKKWVMFPPGVVPPGVHPSPDGADVATPVSLAEWFVNFYPECAEMKVKPVEFVARPGELLFVPHGWWHCALNLTDSCAITQNFVSAVGLQATLSFLRSRRPEMVSGCAHENRCDLYDRFVAALRTQRPDVLATVEARQEEARAKAREANKLAALFRHGPESVAAAAPACAGAAVAASGSSQATASGDAAAPTANGGGGGGFSFGFGLSSGGGSSGAAAAAGGESAAAPAGGGGFRFGFGL